MNHSPETGTRRDVERFRGNRFRVESTPPWVTRRKVMGMDRLPGEPVTVLLLDRQLHAPTSTRYTRIVRRIETHQAVQDLGSIELGFDPATQHLVVHGISIFRAGALINHAAESAFELLQREAGLEQDILNGALTALMVMKDVRVGDILDVEFSIHSDSSLFTSHYWVSEVIGGAHPICRQWLSWIECEGQPLFIQTSGKVPEPEIITTGHGIVRTWSFEHPGTVNLEPDLPPCYKPCPEINITTFADWRVVADLFLGPWSREPDDRAELDAELETLRRIFAADPAAGITAATDLVRHQIRYLAYSHGLFGLVPADPGEVWHRRFGDCKEKSRLLCWLLREMGVKADPVLVHTAFGEGLPETLASPGAFNHVVVTVHGAAGQLWIDPTDVARRGNVSDWKHLPFHHGLPLVPGADRLVPIPREPRGNSGLVVEENLHVDSKSRAADITVKHIYRMGDADMIRHVMDSRGRSAIADYLTDQVRRTRPEAHPTTDLEVTDDPDNNRVVISRQFHCNELLKPTQNGDAEVVFLMPYSIPQRVTGCSNTRKHPLGIQYPADVTHTIRVNSPEPKNTRIPPVSVYTEFFKFSFATTATRTESIHSFSFETLASQVPVAKIRTYSDGLSEVSGALDWIIRFPPRRRPTFRPDRSGGASSW